MYAAIVRAALRRRARSRGERSFCTVYATGPRRRALVMSRSATRRSSLALASVVSIPSCRMRLAVRLRSMARRLLVFRSNFRPAFLWRIALPLVLLLLLLPALEHLGPAVDLHAQGEAHVGQDLLDLLQALAAEVLRLEHVLLGALHQLANELDVRVLQAVRATDAELELVDAAEQVLVERLLFGTRRGVLRLLGLFEVDEDRELLLQNLGRVGDGVLRLHAAVRPDLERQLVVVRLLTDARVGHRVVDLADRREERIDGDGANRHARRLVSLGG